MPSADRRVRRVRLGAPAPGLVRRGAVLLEDALRTASLGGDGGRLLLVRRVDVGRIRPHGAPSTVALALERRVRQAGAFAVHAGDAAAVHSAAVWFHDAVEAHVALALRLARGHAAAEWFWPLAVPRWRPAMGRDEAMRAVLGSVADSAPGPFAAVAVLAALVEEGAAGPLLDALRWHDGPALLRACGWPAPSTPVRLLRAGVFVVAGDGEAADEERAALLGDAGARWTAEITVRAGRWGEDDARTLWLAAAALVTACPSRALDPRLGDRAARLIAAALDAEVVRVPPAASSSPSPQKRFSGDDSASAASARDPEPADDAVDGSRGARRPADRVDAASGQHPASSIPQRGSADEGDRAPADATDPARRQSGDADPAAARDADGVRAADRRQDDGPQAVDRARDPADDADVTASAPRAANRARDRDGDAGAPALAPHGRDHVSGSARRPDDDAAAAAATTRPTADRAPSLVAAEHDAATRADVAAPAGSAAPAAPADLRGAAGRDLRAKNDAAAALRGGEQGVGRARASRQPQAERGAVEGDAASAPASASASRAIAHDHPATAGRATAAEGRRGDPAAAGVTSIAAERAIADAGTSHVHSDVAHDAAAAPEVAEAAPARPRFPDVPVATAGGGLVFLLPALNRLGMAAMLRGTPWAADAAFPARLLRHLTLRTGIPADDPMLAALGADGVFPRISGEAWCAPESWMRGIAAEGPCIVHETADGGRVLFDASGRLPLAAWHGGDVPAGAQARLADAVSPPERGSLSHSRTFALSHWLLESWTVAARRWTRRAARIGLATLLRRPARVLFTRTHVDLLLDHHDANLRVRRAALDVDPGWVPWLGRVVQIHYLYGERPRA